MDIFQLFVIITDFSFHRFVILDCKLIFCRASQIVILILLLLHIISNLLWEDSQFILVFHMTETRNQTLFAYLLLMLEESRARREYIRKHGRKQRRIKEPLDESERVE